MKTQIFTVIPESEYTRFPLDMLRYDCCWPYSQEDVGHIQNTLGLRSLELNSINLKRRVLNKKDVPTEARWKSFGWTVLHIQTI